MPERTRQTRERRQGSRLTLLLTESLPGSSQQVTHSPWRAVRVAGVFACTVGALINGFVDLSLGGIQQTEKCCRFIMIGGTAFRMDDTDRIRRTIRTCTGILVIAIGVSGFAITAAMSDFSASANDVYILNLALIGFGILYLFVTLWFRLAQNSSNNTKPGSNT